MSPHMSPADYQALLAADNLPRRAHEALQQVRAPPEVYLWKPADWETITTCLQRGPRS